MARGAPDYSNVKVPGLIGRVDDMGELAMRLGGAQSVDRLGNISAIENFKYGKSLIRTETAGLGETTEISSSYSRMGGYTLKLNRLANANSYSGFYLYSVVREEGSIGAEVIFTAMTALPNLKLFIGRYTETEHIYWGLRWDGTTGKTYIGSDTDGWTETGETIIMYYGYPIQYSMKIVANEATQEYVRCIVAGQSLTIPTKEPTIIQNGLEPRTVLTFFNGIGPTLASNVYVDVAIITHNEP